MMLDDEGMKGNVWRVLVYEFYKEYVKFSDTSQFLKFFDEFLKFIVHDAQNGNLPQQDKSLIKWYNKHKIKHLQNSI